MDAKCSVRLLGYDPDTQGDVVHAIRRITGWPASRALASVESLPALIREGMTPGVGTAAAGLLTDAGATIAYDGVLLPTVVPVSADC